MANRQVLRYLSKIYELPERQRTNTFARRSKHCVHQRWNDRRQRRLAQPRRRQRTPHPGNGNPRNGVPAQERERIEVLLCRHAIREIHLLTQRLQQSFGKRATHLLFGMQGVDDVAAEITGCPNARNMQGALFHHYSHHFSKVAEVAEIKREAKAMPAFGFSFLPAARATSSKNDWNTKHSELESGARR